MNLDLKNAFGDLYDCLTYNGDDVLRVADLEGAIVELSLTGDSDGPDWHWVVRLATGAYVYVNGGCDYTGWD